MSYEWNYRFSYNFVPGYIFLIVFVTLGFCWFTWKRRIMVQIRPRLSLGLPSTMSCEPIFSKCTLCSRKNCSALSTFSRQWIRILPLVGRGWNTISSLRNVLFRTRKKLCHYDDSGGVVGPRTHHNRESLGLLGECLFNYGIRDRHQCLALGTSISR